MTQIWHRSLCGLVYIAALATCACSGSSPDDDAAGASALCADFQDEPASQTITVRLRNASSAPVFVADPYDLCTVGQVFEVTTAAGEQVALRTNKCGNHTCGYLHTGHEYCTDLCGLPGLIRIEPGGMWEESWPAVGFVETQMPTSCYQRSEDDEGTCSKQVALEPGSYVIRSRAGVNCTGDDECTCEPDAAGSCRTADPSMSALAPEDQIPAEVILDLPGQNVAELVFQ